MLRTETDKSLLTNVHFERIPLILPFLHIFIRVGYGLAMESGTFRLIDGLSTE